MFRDDHSQLNGSIPIVKYYIKSKKNAKIELVKINKIVQNFSIMHIYITENDACFPT